MAMEGFPVGSPVTTRDGSATAKRVPEQDGVALLVPGCRSHREERAVRLEDGEPNRAGGGTVPTLSVVLCPAIQLRHRSYGGSNGSEYDFHRQNGHLGAYYFKNCEPTHRGGLLELLGRTRGIRDQRT